MKPQCRGTPTTWTGLLPHISLPMRLVTTALAFTQPRLELTFTHPLEKLGDKWTKDDKSTDSITFEASVDSPDKDEFAGESLGYDQVAAHNARLEVDASEASGGAIITELKSPDLSEPIAMLCEEVRLCLRYHETLFPSRSIDRVVLTGGESRCRALCMKIARQLKLPMQLGDALALVSRTGTEPAMGVDLSKPQPGWSVALGVCLSPTDL